MTTPRRGMAAAALGLAVIAAAGCGSSDRKTTVQAAAKAPEPLTVQVARAESRRVDRALAVTGELQPDESSTVSSEVPGRITRLLVDFGQPVKRGQVIAEFDKQELELAVERSKATLAQALARVGLEPNQVDQRPDTSPALRQAQAQLEDARSKFESAQTLVKTGDVSQERFTEADKLYRARQAAVDAARDDLRVQVASVGALRAEVRLAEKRLKDATVVAPFDGIVSEKMVAPGQYIKENTPLVTVVKSSPLRLRLEVPESAAALVRPGTQLRFTTDALPTEEFTATVRELNPALNAQSRSLTAEARIPRPDARLRPGMFVQVRLVTQPDSAVTVVPKRALYSVAGLNKVFVIRNNRVAEVAVPPGTADVQDAVEVPSNLVKSGEMVAVSALPQLLNGAAVKVRN